MFAVEAVPVFLLALQSCSAHLASGGPHISSTQADGDVLHILPPTDVNDDNDNPLIGLPALSKVNHKPAAQSWPHRTHCALSCCSLELCHTVKITPSALDQLERSCSRCRFTGLGRALAASSGRAEMAVEGSVPTTPPRPSATTPASHTRCR